jgi:release factor glutamine methyltransferase
MTNKAVFDQFLNEIKEYFDSEREASNVARWLFADAFGVRNFFSEENFDLKNLEKLADFKTRIASGEPIQYILGTTNFFGFMFKTDARALIPRPETEELVDIALRFLKKSGLERARVLDVGTGSGCISIALKKKLPTLDVSAIDVSGDALNLAAENSATLFAPIHFHQFDFLEPKNWSQLPDYQVVISNPPYIPTAEKAQMSARVLDFEPSLALFVTDSNSLIFYEKLAEFALQKLTVGGALFVECNEFNAAEVHVLFQKIGLHGVSLQQDLGGRDRMVVAFR